MKSNICPKCKTEIQIEDIFDETDEHEDGEMPNWREMTCKNCGSRLALRLGVVYVELKDTSTESDEDD